MNSDEKRRLLRQHSREHRAVAEQWKQRRYCYPPPTFPAFPDELVGMKCGARTQAGTPCKRTDLYENGRCKFHGGCSTGPKSKAGKQQARENGKKGGRPRKPKS